MSRVSILRNSLPFSPYILQPSNISPPHPMLTEEHTEYDLLSRVVKQTDALGRITTTEYSTDGLTTTVTPPTGATRITTRNIDGSTASVGGTGQRELHYSYDINNNRLRTTVRTAAGEIVSQTLTNGFGQTVVETEASTTGYIYTRSEYNAKGQMVKQYRDTGAGTATTAPSLYEYDAMGNQVRQILALSDTPTKDNSPVDETSFDVEQREDGVYSVTSFTRYNAEGEPLTSTQKLLISQLSTTLESKSIFIDERGNETTQWSEYGAASERLSYSISPTSIITASSRAVDGFTTSQTDHSGITTTASHHYGKGITQTHTDGRGNTSTTETDAYGRTIRTTDAAGNTTATEYYENSNLPSKVTDALGNTTCYAYDERGRKVAEWGTGVQPTCFGYDEADRMITLTTFRATGEVIDTDPRERTDGDITTWEYHDATGLELCKTYADGSQVLKTYDVFNNLATEIDARGITKTHVYGMVRGQLLSTTYSDGTLPRKYMYNHLGQLTQVIDDAGTHIISYNEYGESSAEKLFIGDAAHIVTEQRDLLGRSIGYTYSYGDSMQQAVTIKYAADGRIATTGFTHDGVLRDFCYNYLPGSNLIEKVTMPNGISFSHRYEDKRENIVEISYHHGDDLVVQRKYTYDALGRPTLRCSQRGSKTQEDTFTYNKRCELVAATYGHNEYAYAYDNIGNRESAQEDAENATTYAVNSLNQYTSITTNENTFVPQFDAAGNQTLVKTSTGIWFVKYNALNRPVKFTSHDGRIVVECIYDFKGCRCFKKITKDGEVILHQCYIYRDYLQIAGYNMLTDKPLWNIMWDVSQPVSTRALAIQMDDTYYTYSWDATKNVCEIFGESGAVCTTYHYTPYGAVLEKGSINQPMQWSSEVYDSEQGLIYYNYRYYNPKDGRWLGRDPLMEFNPEMKHYAYVDNAPSSKNDIKGLFDIAVTVQRTQYWEWETLSDWKAVPVNQKAMVCGSVQGKGIEPRYGEYQLKKAEGYSCDMKIYPLPEGSYSALFKRADKVSIDGLIDSYKKHWESRMKQYSETILKMKKQYEEQLLKYESRFCTWFSKRPQEPNYPPMPIPYNYSKKISMTLPNGEIMELNAEIVHKNVIALDKKNGYSGVCFHAGESVFWSRGCLIIGGSYVTLSFTEKNNSIYRDEINGTIQMPSFSLEDSFNKAEELSRFICCVEKKLGRPAEIKVKYNN